MMSYKGQGRRIGDRAHFDRLTQILREKSRKVFFTKLVFFFAATNLGASGCAMAKPFRVVSTSMMFIPHMWNHCISYLQLSSTVQVKKKQTWQTCNMEYY